ncbi:MAG: hypothetical protein DMG68_19870 [Acidobacteria bacterium]|nr:MAG: hypothetical protein DMG68_19870 [Acidobacteriota bacterium]
MHRRSRAGVLASHDVCDELVVAAGVGASDHDGGSDLRMKFKHLRNVVQFDAVAADLGLRVRAAQVDKAAVGPEPTAIPGAIKNDPSSCR